MDSIWVIDCLVQWYSIGGCLFVAPLNATVLTQIRHNPVFTEQYSQTLHICGLAIAVLVILSGYQEGSWLNQTLQTYTQRFWAKKTPKNVDSKVLTKIFIHNSMNSDTGTINQDQWRRTKHTCHSQGEYKRKYKTRGPKMRMVPTALENCTWNNGLSKVNYLSSVAYDCLAIS